jgi:deoxyribose-phosphate aldolase
MQQGPEFERLVSQITAEVSKRLNGRPLPVAGSHKCDSCQEVGACASLCPSDTFQILDTGAERVSGLPGMGAVEHAIARTIDHTALKPNTTQSQIELLCAEAAKYGFVSVCINPFWIPLAKQLLQQHPVKVCTVVGFPLGAMSTAAKALETRQAVQDGADEIDMVINVGALKSGYPDVVEQDIRAVRDACRGKILKVIIETTLLKDDEKVSACQAAKRAGADFVKTSTGFAGGGATAADIALMRRVVGPSMGVKASGGVRNKSDATLMMAAGATRIGASASVKIMQELPGMSKGSSSSGGGY